MADTSDVEAAIVSLIGAAFYPNGTGQPSTVTAPVNVKRGWPTEAEVRAAVTADTALVRVHAIGGMSRDHTRYSRDWFDAAATVSTLTAAVGNSGAFGEFAFGLSPFGGAPTVTFAGAPAAGQYVGIVCQDIGYARPVAASDTLSTIAAAFAAAIPGATASAAILTLPATGQPPQVTVQTAGTSQVETGRSEQVFVIPVWAPSPALRDAVFQAMLPAVTLPYRLTLPDGTVATLMDFQASGPDDRPSRADEWRRDVRLCYDFAVVSQQTVPPVVVTALEIAPGNGATFTEYAA